MNENNIEDDFSMFATGKRVKKEEVITPRSPLDSGSKWDLHKDVQTEAPRKEYKEPAALNTTPTQTRVQTYSNEEVGNVGSELQKFRKYYGLAICKKFRKSRKTC